MITPISYVRKELFEVFDCGEEDLNLYLKRYALQNDRKGISKTFLLMDENDVVGYYSLSNAQINFEYLNDEIRKRLPRYPIPCIRLARLAVSKSKQKKGYGSLLLKDAFLRVLSIAEQTGVYFVIVDAKEEAEDFYKRFGFQKANAAFPTYLMHVSTIKKAFLSSKKASLSD